MATLTILCGAIALLCLLLLHFLSPEYQPSWRMISEYALGKYKWLITWFFIFWGASSITLGIMLWPVVTTGWAKAGVVLLFIAAIGAIMGGLFDLKHKLHGAAFALGVPTFPTAALLIGYNIVQIEAWAHHKFSILLISHLTWISIVAMGISMSVMMSGFKKAGVPMERDSKPPDRVPDGVIALAGWFNRFLVLCHVGWAIVVAALA